MCIPACVCLCVCVCVTGVIPYTTAYYKRASGQIQTRVKVAQSDLQGEIWCDF